MGADIAPGQSGEIAVTDATADLRQELVDDAICDLYADAGSYASEERLRALRHRLQRVLELLRSVDTATAPAAALTSAEEATLEKAVAAAAATNKRTEDANDRGVAASINAAAAARAEASAWQAYARTWDINPLSNTGERSSFVAGFRARRTAPAGGTKVEPRTPITWLDRLSRVSNEPYTSAESPMEEAWRVYALDRNLDRINSGSVNYLRTRNLFGSGWFAAGVSA